ncbi:hypothetical protein GTO27_05300 [Candidatus Bathyarchaeota archaeon]|nr:hypothetical protein [Candidatus Bathyarchaeota archaeon]
MEFPDRVYTTEEIRRAIELLKNGYKHRLKIDGSGSFKQYVQEALKLVKTAGYLDFLRTYIRRIEEIDGLTQLREADATIWANEYAVRNPVDAASLFVQKANHMKEYLEGRLYYGGKAEARSVQKRVEFLRKLKQKSQDEKVKNECARLLEIWSESVFL